MQFVIHGSKSQGTIQSAYKENKIRRNMLTETLRIHSNGFQSFIASMKDTKV